MIRPEIKKIFKEVQKVQRDLARGNRKLKSLGKLQKQSYDITRKAKFSKYFNALLHFQKPEYRLQEIAIVKYSHKKIKFLVKAAKHHRPQKAFKFTVNDRIYDLISRISPWQAAILFLLTQIPASGHLIPLTIYWVGLPTAIIIGVLSEILKWSLIGIYSRYLYRKS